MDQNTELTWKTCTWVAQCEQIKTAELKHARGWTATGSRGSKSRLKNQERFYTRRYLVKPDGDSQYNPSGWQGLGIHWRKSVHRKIHLSMESKTPQDSCKIDHKVTSTLRVCSHSPNPTEVPWLPSGVNTLSFVHLFPKLRLHTCYFCLDGLGQLETIWLPLLNRQISAQTAPVSQ